MKKNSSRSKDSKDGKFYNTFNVIERERLIKILDSGLEGAVTLVSAPAGYGKTVAVRQWAQKRKFHVHEVDFALQPDHVVQPASTSTLYLFEHCDKIRSKNLYESIMNKMMKLPDHSHAVFITREEPPFSLSRWRLSGKLNEIRMNDLKFANQEIKQLFIDLSGTHLDAFDMNMIHAYTEGWPAAVSYAARRHNHESDFRKSFQVKPIFDFFHQEVFGKLDSEVQHFMLKSSMLETMDASLSNELAGIKNGLEILQEATLNNWFVFQDYHRRNRWRYHPLFALFLQSECIDRFGEEVFRSFHLQAARWLFDHAEPDAAIDHALEGENEDLARIWIIKRAYEHIRKGEYHQVSNWLNRISNLPKDLLDIKGWIHAFDQEYDQALRCFKDAHDGEDSKSIECSIGEGYVAICEYSPHQALEKFKEATESGEQVSWIFRKGIDLNFGETELLKGRIGMGGRLREVWELYSQIEALWKHKDLAVFAYGSAIKAELFYEKNQLKDVVNFIMKGIELGHRYHNISVLVSIHIGYMKFKKATGHLDEMWIIFDNIRKIVAQSHSSTEWLSVLRAYEIRMMLLEKKPDPEEIKLWLKEYPLSELEEVDFKKEFEVMTVVRCFIHQRKYTRALKLLKIWHRSASIQGRIGSQIESGLLMSLLLNKRGNSKKACLYLYEALYLGQQEGYVRSFLDHGYPLSQLIALALQNSPKIKNNRLTADYGKYLLTLFENELGIRNWSRKNRTLTEPLTDRELQILRCIVNGLSNSVIAGSLGIKVGTVKTHIVNLYGKLGVESRAQAVVKAEELGLVQL